MQRNQGNGHYMNKIIAEEIALKKALEEYRCNLPEKVKRGRFITYKELEDLGKKANLFTKNEVIQRILKTMKDVKDVEKYIGIRFKKENETSNRAEIYDSRLGINAEKIIGFNVSNVLFSSKQRIQAVKEFERWLEGFREKLSNL